MDEKAGQRLERARAAYADRTGHDGSTLPLGADRGTGPPSWWTRWRGPALCAAAVLVTTGVIVGGNQVPPPDPATAADDPPTSLVAPTASVEPRPATGPPATGPVFPYDLSTHCGIDEARIGEVYFEADEPLAGPGDPPPDWVRPFQPGWMTVLGTDRAVFSDDRGHEVSFTARPGATAFKQVCDQPDAP